MKSTPPNFVKSFFVVDPINAIAPKVPAVTKKVLAMMAIFYTANIHPRVRPLMAEKRINHRVALARDSL